VGWALVVWVFGEAFGGIFAPGLSWTTGAPGAVLVYAAAGVLIALPEPAWRGRRLGRIVTACVGLFFVGMAVLQAWPGRGTWQGGSGRHAGNLVTMVRTMSATHQPRFLAGWLSSFASFDGAHGWGVNLFLVVALGAIGVALCSGRRPLLVPAAAAAAVLCLADWVLVQDLGFLGGVGTDPNSMIPTVLLLAGGVVALLRAPAVVSEPAFVSVRQVAAMAPSGRWDVLTPGVLARAAAALVALAVILVGAVPMAAASSNPNVDPIVTEAVNGTPDLVNSPAPGFSLVDQSGRPVSLSDLRGRAIALTFLDPVCTSDCPLIAQSFRQADQMLGSEAQKTEFVAVVANPIYRSVAAVEAFDRQEGMSALHNWLYLTGSLQALTRVWNRYGIQVAISPAGAMVDHSDLAYIIDGGGRIRAVLGANPGTTAASHASMSTLVADQLRAVIGE
jgi:cytochrome oxidase Cu insertion factor (SCO1/SenC/PrrC family)